MLHIPPAGFFAQNKEMRKLKETNVIQLAFAVLMCCLLNPALKVHAQGEVRALSLQQCFETALENNLTVQIERVNPELSLYDLRVSEGAYDPSFFFSYRQQNRQEPGRFDPTNVYLHAYGRGANGNQSNCNR